ncbi:hypothetical protein CKAN_01121300 [Cinnamomum micranthum f. kanehirae]|uniref:Uncharacterized protein n=1 Tax=Cinnamomum micranthum f. kanehirae TaxID=337451 RepID=A0A3S4NWD5_9MAGN|nr:hypothetical protein CKAN_01121300 [Cinnamomum micranthum f. kanehirae]
MLCYDPEMDSSQTSKKNATIILTALTSCFLFWPILYETILHVVVRAHRCLVPPLLQRSGGVDENGIGNRESSFLRLSLSATITVVLAFPIPLVQAINGRTETQISSGLQWPSFLPYGNRVS